MTHDETFMRHALDLARRAWGCTHPNPMVGAVVVRDGVILAEGWHAAAGEAHAEVAAIRNLEDPASARGATLYVTLEPCSTTGRTPPCTEAILRAGFARVVIGTLDPNPAHSGSGLDILRERGVEVVDGVLEAECRRLNLVFNQTIVTGRPLIAAKVAVTLDGKVATRTGHSQWITGDEARADVMRWRRYFPAIGVGQGTLLADNPGLTSRLPGQEPWCPVRFVFDRSGRLTVDEITGKQLFSDAHCDRTILVRGTESGGDPGGKVGGEPIPGVATTWHLDRATFWQDFATRALDAGLTGIYLEPGPRLLSGLIAESVIDYLFCYIAPKFVGDAAAPAFVSGMNVTDINTAPALRDVVHASFGRDVLVRGFLR